MRRLRPAGPRTATALFLLVLAATALFVQDNRANSTSRLALTAAVTEQQTVVIDDYEQTLDVDRAEKDGHLYSDKAPGQPLAAVPLWAAYRAVGGDPGTEPRLEGHLGLWWITLWFAAVPGALLAVLLHRYASAVGGRDVAVPSAIALFAGSILLPFSTMLFGHVLAALLTMASFLWLRSAIAGDGRRPLLLAGAAASAAVSVEYTVALVVLVLLVAATIRHRRHAWPFLAGMAPIGALLATYHWIAFGGPLEHPYKYSVFQVHHDSFAGIGVPDPALLVEVLVGERGLLTLTPIVAVAIAGLVLRRDRVSPLDLGVPLAVLGCYLVFASGWVDATGGWSPGTRHLLPALPFLAGGLALAWAAWPRVCVAASVWSVAVMTLATVTDPQVPDTVPSALRFWLDHVRDGDLARTVLSPVLGRVGLVVVAALVAAAALALRRSDRPDRDAGAPSEGRLSAPRPSPVGGP